MNTHPSFCRVCQNNCPILVTVDGGRAVEVTGDKANEMFGGYTCVKGRAWPEMINHSARLHHSLKRTDAGYVSVSSEQAMDEIATRLIAIRDEYGPRAIATYLGTHAYVAGAMTMPFMDAFADAVGTPMRFTPVTIDQPGKWTAKFFYGGWMTEGVPFWEAEVAMFVGHNPLVSHFALPGGNPGRMLEDAKRRGVKMVVIDPRRSEIARRAFLHLQPHPGEDVPILAAMLRTILDEGLIDHHFVQENVAGIERLRSAVDLFTAEEAAHRAGVSADDIRLAARTYATSSGGWAFVGTGANMANRGTLLEYLVLCLKGVCGDYRRAGERVTNPGTLVPTFPAKAQAMGPFGWPAGEPMQVRGLTITPVGPPVVAAADAMLLEGEGRLRALLSCGGNPVSAWPDQRQTVAGLQNLDLLVQVDPFMSLTARMADYVIAPTMGLEVSATTYNLDVMEFNLNPVYPTANGQYTGPIAERPAGSDLIEEWQFFYGLAQRLGLELTLHAPMDGISAGNAPPLPIDMVSRPSTDEMLALMATGSRIPLETVKQHPHGGAFPEPPLFVAPKDEGWTGRLDVGADEMMTDLRDLAATADEHHGAAYPFRLISRRSMQVMNSSNHDESTMRGRPYNPAFMNPSDLERLQLAPRDLVEIRSPHDCVVGIVEADPSVRIGVISMSHCFGTASAEDDDPWASGTSTARLVDRTQLNDRYSGQPRMSAIPVTVVIASAEGSPQ